MNDYGFDYMNYITNIPNSINYNQPKKMNMNYTNSNQSMNIKMMNKTVEPNEGLIRGNLFSNQYEPYKGYKAMDLKPKNEKEALLYQVMQYKFALIELNLYLDTHPNDVEMIKLYNQYLDIEKKMCNKYESMYGPLTLGSDYLDNNTWVWKNSPWPWEVM